MAEDKKPEAKTERRAKMYDHPSSTKHRGGEEKAEPKSEAKAEKKGGEEPGDDTHAKARQDMMKRHETERRDLHGSHRDDHRKMQARHEADHKAMAAQEAAAQTQAQQTLQPPGAALDAQPAAGQQAA